MAGSYDHATTKSGKLRSNETIFDMLENGGDVYEALEEMYGMIWYLAEGQAHNVEEARKNYKHGIAVSPGVQK